jgi:two-component system sensor histidine kinase KdpD
VLIICTFKFKDYTNSGKMADAFSGNFTALYIETPGFVSIDETNKKRLKQNMKLARQLGAKVETVRGDDVPYQIAEFARLSGVTKIVIGRSAAVKKPPYQETDANGKTDCSRAEY